MTDRPVGWLEAPHGKFRANSAHKLVFPPSTTVWAVPLFLHAQDTRLREAARMALDHLDRLVEFSSSEGPDMKAARRAAKALREALGEDK